MTDCCAACRGVLLPLEADDQLRDPASQDGLVEARLVISRKKQDLFPHGENL